MTDKKSTRRRGVSDWALHQGEPPGKVQDAAMLTIAFILCC
jgi:hypothetical protein